MTLNNTRSFCINLAAGVLLIFCSLLLPAEFLLAEEYQTNNQNIGSLFSDADGQYHLQEDIIVNNTQWRELSDAAANFHGVLYGHFFYIRQLRTENEGGGAGVFPAIGDGASIVDLSIEDAQVLGDEAGILAGEIGHNSVIRIVAIKNSLLNCLGNGCGFLIGRSGDNNTVSLIYTDGLGVHGRVKATALVGIAGNNNRLSIGYSDVEVIGGEVAGVTTSGFGNVIVDSVIESRLIMRGTGLAKAITTGENDRCENCIWSTTATGSDDSGCQTEGLTSSEIMDLNSQSPGLPLSIRLSFRFGNSGQKPLAIGYGNTLGSLDDAVCQRLSCQPDCCDYWQGQPIFQDFDSQYRRYIITLEKMDDSIVDQQRLAFRVIRKTSDNEFDQSFGDQGIIRYPYSTSSRAVSDLTATAGLIENNEILLAGMDQNGRSLVLKLPLNSDSIEDFYTVHSPNINGTPRLITRFGNMLLVLTAARESAASTQFRIYHLRNLTLNSALIKLYDFEAPLPSPLAYALDFQSLVMHVFSETLTGDRRLYRVNLLNEDDFQEFSPTQLIDEPETAALFSRDIGLWLVETNNLEEFSVELFDTRHSGENATEAYSYNGTDLVAGSLFSPDNQQRPVIHLVYFEDGCLETDTEIQTETITPEPGALDGLYQLLFLIFSELKIYLHQIFVLYDGADKALNGEN